MTEAQIYASYCKAHKKLCAEKSVSSDIVASVILLSLVHSHLNYEFFSNIRNQDNKSIKLVSETCDVSYEDITYAYNNISSETISSVRSIIARWGITFDVYENIFGALFEKYITKKDSGAYYTSPLTTEYITLRSLITYVLQDLVPKDTLYLTCQQKDLLGWFNKLILHFDEENRKLIYNRLTIVNIIDPTCGTGAFLFQAFKCILQIYKQLQVDIDSSLIKNIISSNLYGVDIDPEAIAILKFRFLILAESFGISHIDLSSNFKIGNTLNSIEFNWEGHFSNGGKFDIVVGNPPYVESSKVQRCCFDADLQTLDCGNLYAYVTEKVIKTILKENGILGFIIPISVVSTSRMAPLRKVIIDNSKECFFSHFADRPGCLFIGVHQKLTVCMLVKSSTINCQIYTSSYFHWDKEQENELFFRVTPYRINIAEPTGIIPKIGSDTERDILSKVSNSITKTNLLETSVKDGTYSVWLNMRMCFWAKSFCSQQTSNEYKRFDFDCPQYAKAFSAFLNSSLFFFVWEATSDCWHVTTKDLNVFKFSIDEIPTDILADICEQYDKYESALEQTKKYIGSVQTEYIYQHKFHKGLIDKIDDLFARFFKFNKRELDFIKNYQIKYRLNNAIQKSMTVIDLFSGVGGLSLGFENAGYNVILANEIDPEIALSYRCNHPGTLMLNCDIKELADDIDGCIKQYSGIAGPDKINSIQEQLKLVDVIIGGPPCQGFSMAGGRIRKAKVLFEDPRNYLFHQYFRIIQKYEPKYFVFENVVGLLSSKNGEILETIKALFSDDANFQKGGYSLNIKVFDASDFGVPQCRKRVLIIGSKKSFNLEKTIQETISSLEPDLRDKFLTKRTVRDAISDLAVHVGEDGYPNHCATIHSQKALERIKKIKPNQNFTSLDEDIKSVHSGAYGRLDWDKPATTITTRFDTPSAGRYIHPDADRTITQREAARLQSFPDTFVFRGSKSSICKQIGNAVPPQLAEFVARIILHLENS